MTIYQVDAFNNQLFTGNPAAVIPLDKWISSELMQSIAEENNLSETVFFVPVKNRYKIKWFTPTCEIDLCGHATLAAAHILYTELNFKGSTLIFESKSGRLKVHKTTNWYTLNFPTEEIFKIDIPPNLSEALKDKVIACYKGKWKLVVLMDDEAQIQNLDPDFGLLSKLDYAGIIVTAPGDKVDFVSRFFAPKLGINEDPVTGSAHTLLIPFWSKKLNKSILEAEQLSKRKGVLKCQHLNERVEMSGQAITYLRGEIAV